MLTVTKFFLLSTFMGALTLSCARQNEGAGENSASDPAQAQFSLGSAGAICEAVDGVTQHLNQAKLDLSGAPLDGNQTEALTNINSALASIAIARSNNNCRIPQAIAGDSGSRCALVGSSLKALADAIRDGAPYNQSANPNFYAAMGYSRAALKAAIKTSQLPACIPEVCTPDMNIYSTPYFAFDEVPQFGSQNFASAKAGVCTPVTIALNTGDRNAIACEDLELNFMKLTSDTYSSPLRDFRFSSKADCSDTISKAVFPAGRSFANVYVITPTATVKGASSSIVFSNVLRHVGSSEVIQKSGAVINIVK